MPILSNCPKCKQPVTVPDGVDPADRVRCPLCDAEYPLSEAMESAPPALIRVDAAPAETEPPTDTEPPGEGLSPDFGDETDYGLATETDGTPAIDTGATAVDAEAFAQFTPGDESAGEPESLTATMKKRRQQEKKKSGLWEIPKIIGGGIAGLIIGYYILNLWRGEEWDYMKVYLPFVEHTQNHWPFNDGKEDPAADADKKQPSKEKPGVKKPDAQEPVDNDNELADDELGDSRDALDDPIAEFPLGGSQAIIGPGTGTTFDWDEKLKVDLGPKNPPSFTSDELGKALKAANDAINGEDATGAMTDEAYGHFCRLAHLVTFAAAGQQLIDRELAVGGLLEDLAEKPGQFDRIGGLAGALWDAEVTEGGILLAGTVLKVGAKDGLHAIVVKLPQPYDDSVLLMKDKSLFIKEKDKVLMLGSIVVDPKENVAGYAGSQKRVIWAGMAHVLASE